MLYRHCPETRGYEFSLGKIYPYAPKIFAQLTKRDGCFLIGRNPEPDFKWENLSGKEVIIGRKGGLPAMTFEYTVKNLGLNNLVNLRTDIQFNLMGPTFDGGTGDYVTLFEPTATEFVSQGKGHIVASVGEKSGEIPYTSFIALDSFLTSNPEKVEKFVRALYKALKYVETEPSSVVAEYLIKHFKGSKLDSTAKSLDNYKRVDTWMSNMSLPEDMFNKLLAVIENAGEDVDGVKYSDVVENKYATKIYNQLKTA